MWTDRWTKRTELLNAVLADLKTYNVLNFMWIRVVGYSMHVLQINVCPRQRIALCIVLVAGNQARGCDCASLSIFAFAFISVYNEHCTIDYRNPSQKRNS